MQALITLEEDLLRRGTPLDKIAVEHIRALVEALGVYATNPEEPVDLAREALGLLPHQPEFTVGWRPMASAPSYGMPVDLWVTTRQFDPIEKGARHPDCRWDSRKKIWLDYLYEPLGGYARLWRWPPPNPC